MKSEIDLGIDTFLLSYYENEFDCIENYFEALNGAVNSEKERINSLAEYLKSKGASDDYVADSLDDDSFNLSFFEDNTYNFAIVFLFSECEKLLKQDYGILSGKSSKAFFKFENAKKAFDEEGIDLKTLPNYSKLNEIRSLNNCIKHNGYVNEELYNLNKRRWLLNTKIKVQYSEIQQFLKDVRSFFDSLVPLIDSKNREKITKEDIIFIRNICTEFITSKTADEQNRISSVLNKLNNL